MVRDGMFSGMFSEFSGTCMVCLTKTDTAVQVNGEKQQLVRALQALTGDSAKAVKIQVRQMARNGHVKVQLCRDCATHERGPAKRLRPRPIPVGPVVSLGGGRSDTARVPSIDAAQIINPVPLDIQTQQTRADVAPVPGLPPLDTQAQHTRSGRMGKMYEPYEELMSPVPRPGTVSRDGKEFGGISAVAPQDDAGVRAGKQIVPAARGVVTPEMPPGPITAEWLGEMRDLAIQRQHRRALEAAEACKIGPQLPVQRAGRRTGPTLQDDLARYNGRVWDPIVDRWIDHGVIAPTPACVHFNIDNVFHQLKDDYESINEAGREIFARHGVPFWMDDEPPEDPQAWCKAYFTTLREQYPRPTAPYGECWLESGLNVDRVACHLTVTTAPTPHLYLTTSSDLGETSTYVNGLIYVDDKKTGFPSFMALFVIRLDVNGEIVGVDWETCLPHELGQDVATPFTDDNEPVRRAYTTVVLRAVLLTFSLCNARNIRQQVVREAKPASKKQRNAKPLVEVREIRIDGTMTPSSNEPPKTHRGPVRAHKVRAHWRRYGPKYGTGLLFGRYEALIFQPAGRRGLEALGVVDQRYRVIPRKDAKDQQ